jgi:hypothetical protein
MIAHGQRRFYRAGCRCVRCRASNAAYVTARRAAPRVPAAPVRQHILALQAQGLGYRRVAALAGIGASSVLRLRAGRRTWTTPATAARVLKVRPALAHGTRVASWRLLRKLEVLRQHEDYSTADLARGLGVDDGRLRFGPKITVRIALAIRAAWARSQT